jgi:phosphoglycolate phosphatase
MAAPLLVFDLDGTLVDTALDLLATLEVVFDRNGYPLSYDPTLRNGIGHGVRHLIEYTLHRQRIALEPEEIDRLHAAFLEHYEANIALRSRPYAGLEAALDRFAESGWSFAVCTNKLEGLSRKLIEEVGLTRRFAAICGGDTFANRKPHPGHLLDTIERAGGKSGRAVMVGDSRTDLDTARAARVAFVGVSFGYTPVPMADLGPDLLVDSFEDFMPRQAANLLGEAEGVQHREASAALT